MSRNRLLSATTALLLLPLVSAAFAAPGDEAAAWRRDPFRYQGMPLTAAADEMARPAALPEELHLKGIVLGRDGRYRALISNREYQAGDSVAGVLIRAISRFEIIVEDSDGIRKVGLFHDH